MRIRNCWLARVLRERRLDRNPLRRRSDRAETMLLGALLAAFLAAAPFAGHAAGNWAYQLSAREAQAQRAALRQVPATLLQTASPWNSLANTGGVAPEVDARWRAPDGQLRTGKLLVLVGAAAGSTVPVWVDQAGRLADAPLNTSMMASRGQMAAAGAVGALAAVLFAVGWLTRRALDRRRLAGWDAEWLAILPRR
jgi:hypothetical protein